MTTPITPASTTQKVPIKLQGADGCIYVVNMDSSAFSSSEGPTTNLATFSPPAPPSQPPSIPSSSLALAHDVVEYDGWIVIEEELTTNLDWSKHNIPSTMMTIHTSDISPISQSNNTPISTDSHPFWMDSGTSVHVSPDRTDFLTLKAVTPLLS
jgi:hypothetical protein